MKESRNNKMIAAGFALSAIALFPVSGMAQEYWSARFNSGSIPTGITVEAPAGPEVIDKCYRNVKVDKSWAVANFGGRYSALAASHTRSSEPVGRRFVSPVFKVEDERAILTWEGCTVLPGFPEAYRVLVRESGGDFEAIWETDNEPDSWTHHAVSLAEYAGKDIEVAFECVSVNKFLLAIDSIWAGVQENLDVTGSVSNRIFVANGEESEVEARLFNAGGFPEGFEVVLTAGGKEIGIAAIPSTSSPEQAVSWSFIADSDVRTDYSVTWRCGEKSGTVGSGEIWSSNFARTLFLDEGTGMWCNNCFEGIMAIHDLVGLYGDQISPVANHANDIFQIPEYWQELKFYSVPYFKLNRIASTASGSIKDYSGIFARPVEGEIEISQKSIDVTSALSVSGKCRFAEGVEGLDGVGVGYVVTADFFYDDVDGDFYQSNNATLPSKKQYYFLPTKIYCDLTRLDHVNIDGTYGFNPVVSFEKVESGKDYDFQFDIPLPEVMSTWRDWSNVTVTAFLLHPQSGEILNAGTLAVDPDDTGSGIISAESGMDTRVSLLDNSTLYVALSGADSNAEVKVLTIDGVTVGRASLHEGENYLSIPEGKGVLLISVSNGNHNVTKKLIR